MVTKKSETKVASGGEYQWNLSREKTLFLVYILRTSSNTLYIGQTNNLEKRLKQHASHTSNSAKYLRMFTSFELVYSEKFNTRAEAMNRESQLKKWSRVKKELLISGSIKNLKKYKSNNHLNR